MEVVVKFIQRKSNLKLLNISEKLQNGNVSIKSEVMIEKVSPGMSVEILKLIESNLDYSIENIEMDIEIHLEDVYGLVAKSKNRSKHN